MNISLNPELQKFVEELVQAGRFASATEALEAGLARLMLDPLPDELDSEDLAAIAESEEQIRRGEDLDWKQVSAQFRQEAHVSTSGCPHNRHRWKYRAP